MKIACAIRMQLRLRFAQECLLTQTCAAVVGDKRYDRLGARVLLFGYQW